MDDEQIDRNIKFAQSVASAYGYEAVAASAAYEAFADHTKLADRGFARTGPGMYCREVTASLAHVVKLQALKGGAYQPHWGVSLGFMPHTWKPKVKYHPSIKAARLDLFERSAGIDRSPRNLWDIGMIGTLNGHEYMRATLQSMWSDYETAIFDWFSRALDFQGCLEIAGYQATSSDWAYRTHFPPQKLVHAFLLAKVGRHDEAERELAHYCTEEGEDDAARAELQRALAGAQ